MIARILTMALAAFFLGANIESVALAGGSFDVTIKESEAPGAPDSQTPTLYRASRGLCLESGGNWFWRLSERVEFCGGQAARSRVSSAIS